MERGKQGENEKAEWRNGGRMWWKGNRRGIGRGKFWIGVWMRENGREREGNS